MVNLKQLLNEIRRLKDNIYGAYEFNEGLKEEFIGKLKGIKETVEAVTSHMEDSGEILYEGSEWLAIKEELK